MYLAVLPFLPMNFYIKCSDLVVGNLDRCEKCLGDDLYNSLKVIEKNNSTFWDKEFGVSEKQLVVAMGNNYKLLETFLEVFIFYAHKNHLEKVVSSPTSWCYEDFQYKIFDYTEGASPSLIYKTKFKYTLLDFEKLIFYPQYVENISLKNEPKHFPVNLEEFSRDSFQIFYDAIVRDQSRYLALKFYNMGLKTLISDEERYMFLCTALEILFDCSERGKRDCLKEEIVSWYTTKRKLKYLEPTAVEGYLAKFIDVIYDFRSAYVHVGKKTSDKLATLDDVIDEGQLPILLLNIVSQKIAENFIRPGKLEGLLLSGLFSRNSLNSSLKFYKKSADHIADEVAKFQKAIDNFEDGLELSNLFFRQCLRLNFSDATSLRWRADDQLQVNNSLKNIDWYLFRVVQKYAPTHQLALLLMDKELEKSLGCRTMSEYREITSNCCMEIDFATGNQHCCLEILKNYFAICDYERMKTAIY